MGVIETIGCGKKVGVTHDNKQVDHQGASTPPSSPLLAQMASGSGGKLVRHWCGQTFARPLPWSTHRCPQKCTDKRQLSKTTTLHRPPLASSRGARAVRRTCVLRNKANREPQRNVRLDPVKTETCNGKKNKSWRASGRLPLLKCPARQVLLGVHHSEAITWCCLLSSW